MRTKPYLFRHNDKVICAWPKRGKGNLGGSSALGTLHRQSCCSQCFPLLFIVCHGSARENFPSSSSHVEPGLGREEQSKRGRSEVRSQPSLPERERVTK